MEVVDRRKPRAEDLVALLQMAQVRARVVAGTHSSRSAGSIGPVSAWKRLLRMFSGPSLVNSWPLRACRVGITQSNMSMPRATAFTRSAGVPTPIR